MQNKREKRIAFRDLGLIDYKEAWELQEKTLDAVVEQKLSGEEGESPSGQVVYFCEHPHVFTLGKSGENENLLITEKLLQKIKASFYKIDRGGDITYHGPGQIVGYPVVDLEALGIKVRDYVWMLEESVIRTLHHYGIIAERLEGATGVWLETATPGKTRKICAIGVRLSRYVTMHGFAFNVNTDLNYFEYINPCGYTDKGVTSLEKEKGLVQDMDEVRKVLREKISEVFQIKLITS